MNKTLILAVMLIAMVGLIVVIMNTDYNFENTKQMSSSVSPYKSNFHTYDENIGEISVAPLRKFCAERGMEMWTGRTYTDTGCKDSSRNIYRYDIKFDNNIWTIGDKTYEAVWR